MWIKSSEKVFENTTCIKILLPHIILRNTSFCPFRCVSGTTKTIYTKTYISLYPFSVDQRLKLFKNTESVPRNGLRFSLSLQQYINGLIVEFINTKALWQLLQSNHRTLFLKRIRSY